MKYQKKQQIRKWAARIVALVLALGLILSTLVYSLMAAF